MKLYRSYGWSPSLDTNGGRWGIMVDNMVIKDIN